MLGLDADILVLQEVDAIHRHYAKPLMDAGYDWIYQTKKHGTFRSSEYVVPPKEELDSPGGHGLMIAWRKDEFKCINYKGIFYDEHPLCSPTRITPITNNIAQIIALEFVKRPGGIVLSNTHLYWRYQATYEKLRQLWILLAETHLWSDEIDQNTNRHIPNTSWPIVLCGDFNTEPMDAPYKLLTRTDLPLSRELLDTCRVVEHDGSHRDCEGGEKDMDTGFPDHTPEFLIEKILSFPPCRSAYADYEGNVGKERYELNPDRGRQCAQTGGNLAILNKVPSSVQTIMNLVLPAVGVSVRKLDAHLYSQNFTIKDLIKFSDSCPSVEEVDLSCCFSLDDDALFSFFAQNVVDGYCRSDITRRFTAVGCTFLSNRIFSLTFQNLQSLNISGCFLVTNSSLEKIMKECLFVEAIDASYCWRLTDEFSAFLEVPQDNACRRLHTFQVQFCYQISDGIFQALANGIVTAHRLLNLAMLKNLDMRQTGISTMMKHMIQGLGMEMESSHVEE
ncbi:MAG: hypothetical protein SGCHY_003609 [Lobulomycetales sp.]